MSPRTGRPKSENPKSITKRARMTVEDVEKLQYCCEKTGKSESDIIRLGIEMVYGELKE